MSQPKWHIKLTEISQITNIIPKIRAKKSNFTSRIYNLKSALQIKCSTPHKSPSPINASTANNLKLAPSAILNTSSNSSFTNSASTMSKSTWRKSREWSTTESSTSQFISQTSRPKTRLFMNFSYSIRLKNSKLWKAHWKNSSCKGNMNSLHTMTSTHGKSSYSAMTHQKCSDKSPVSTFKNFLSSKASLSAQPNHTSRHQSSNSSVKIAIQSSSLILLQAKLLLYRWFVWEEWEMTRDALKILLRPCLTVKSWTFRVWKFKKTLKKSQVDKSPEPTT
jgi:hypothetical protein